MGQHVVGGPPRPSCLPLLTLALFATGLIALLAVTHWPR